MVGAPQMIKRILIENYRCFEKAVIEPDSLALLVGPNGAGKSTVFEVLFKIRQLVTGNGSVSELFPDNTRTRWGREATQRFELELGGPRGDATYRLVLCQGDDVQIDKEEILYEGELLYTFSREEVTIHSQEEAAEYRFPAGDKLSPLSNLPKRLRSTRLVSVIERIFQIWVFRPVPHTLAPFTNSRADFLEPDLSNFASWLHRLLTVRPSLRRILKPSLRIVLEGFLDFKFQPLGRSKILMFMFASPRRRRESVLFGFDELSEGQRALFVLYTLVHAIAGEATTLCIDEPEGFLSPREIQPWLNLVMEKTGENGQAILISHNPGLIDLLASSNGILLDRERGGPVRVRSVPGDDSGLPVSELISRGWLE